MNFAFALRPIALLLALAGVAPAAPLTPGVDEHTVAFWPFDEVPYKNMTLTDASQGFWDLRLRPAGDLQPGRWGNALRVGALPGAATMFAETPGIQEVGILASRPSLHAAPIFDAIHGERWTVEFWLRLASAPTTERALLNMATDSAAFFSAHLEAGGGAIIVRVPAEGIHARLPLATPLAADGQWRHVAIIGGLGTLAPDARVCIDGVPQPMGAVIPAAGPEFTTTPTFEEPGLIAAMFSDPNFSRPDKLLNYDLLDNYWGLSIGSGWSMRLHSNLTAPVTGTVNFRADAQWGMRLYLDGNLVIDGWGPTMPRTGSLAMTAGERVPMTVEFNQQGSDARLRMYWTLPGGEEEIIPASAYTFDQEDLQTAAADLGQSAPTIAPRQFEVRVGTTFLGNLPLDGWVDELRVSSTARYLGTFEPPPSLTFTHGPNAPAPDVPNGPPLLFDGEQPPLDVLPLGGRKHVFIDDVLLEPGHGMQVVANPWVSRQRASFRPSGDPGILDHEGEEVWIYDGTGDFWAVGGGEQTRVRLFTSADGVNFTQPSLGIVEWGGSTANNIVLREGVQGQVFVDTNPAAWEGSRYKMTMWQMSRGIYLFTSPDGLNWSRHETMMLPFDCGGGVESFWDDQRGEHATLLRYEGFLWGVPPNGRASVLSTTSEPAKPWPFERSASPKVRLPYLTLPTPTTELPAPFVPNVSGQVYRTRAMKYEHAPDVYYALPWRYKGTPPEDYRESELAVSRDGRTWQFFGEPFYMSAEGEIDGQVVREALSLMGMVRRGDELWNYATIEAQTHSGTGGSASGMYKFVQRLDGFTSLDGGSPAAFATTRPFTLEGNRLVLNIKSAGVSRVGILDEAGNAFPGYALPACDAITTDAIRHEVSWNGFADVSALEGQVVRLRLRLEDAKLFALQFEEKAGEPSSWILRAN